MNGPRSIKRNESKDPVAKAKRDRADRDEVARDRAETDSCERGTQGAASPTAPTRRATPGSGRAKLLRVRDDESEEAAMTNERERAEERLARIRARRGTPERVAAVEAIRAAQAPPAASRPEGTIQEGFAFELRAGDWVTTVGGRDGNTFHKRMRFEDRVEAAGRAPRQRTRGHVIFERCGDWTFPTRTPVRFIRPNSNEEA